MTKKKEPPDPPPRRRLNNLRRDKNGLPLIEPKENKWLVGKTPLPDTEDKSHLMREQAIHQTEVLMIKGFSTASLIATTLGIAPATAKNYIEAVEYRWAIRGSGMRKVLLRGKAQSRLEIIVSELWQIFNNSDSEGVQLAALSRLMQAHEQQMVVDGLTPKTLVQIAMVDSAHSEDTYEEAVDRFKRLRSLADKLTNYIDGEVVKV